ncbi:DUF3710 domain-containing protein [Nocardioides sp. MAH-18]|uniref:DUF3710 domain-containing protein n=1 Tax=Nocardioides agri TaxID=2682843 RepID=A0A6L6XW39_9ACTN|nr:DUF3710 domain-containing protein [Nocardioides sp. CGMCC 1.13656]MBA2952442.1 DUF3710 domain-containing protein [Nocardioides sp. CGMCC 1.13656]MVQ51604.1 DUF3710 domain-containing protein [Nocardioides sp. MAH-18]
MKFRRKSEPAGTPADELTAEDSDTVEPIAPEALASGPWDVDDFPGSLDDGRERVDLGALVLTVTAGLDVRLQVDEATERVQSVLVAGPEGAVELRVFAAPRHGDLWGDVRPRIASEYAQRGGTATEHDGRYGRELLCQLTVRTEDGRTATQPSRVVGINGPRWMLRATLLGRPAVEPHTAGPWDDVIASTVVRRGAQAMPVGSELPLTLPPRDKLERRES